MRTNPDTNRQLSVVQLNAIDLLVQGRTDDEVAEAVGVTRQTVNGWRNHDAGFLAQLNERRAALWGADLEVTRRRLGGLLRRALDALEADLDGQDPRLKQAAAVHVLRCSGVYGADLTPVGETDPKSIESE